MADHRLPGRGLEVPGLDHLYVSVSDFERSERFYHHVCFQVPEKKGA